MLRRLAIVGSVLGAIGVDVALSYLFCRYVTGNMKYIAVMIFPSMPVALIWASGIFWLLVRLGIWIVTGKNLDGVTSGPVAFPKRTKEPRIDPDERMALTELDREFPGVIIKEAK